jgi:hypothetical protein
VFGRHLPQLSPLSAAVFAPSSDKRLDLMVRCRAADRKPGGRTSTAALGLLGRGLIGAGFRANGSRGDAGGWPRRAE